MAFLHEEEDSDNHEDKRRNKVQRQTNFGTWKGIILLVSL